MARRLQSLETPDLVHRIEDTENMEQVQNYVDIHLCLHLFGLLCQVMGPNIVLFEKLQQSNSGAVLASPSLKFPDYEVVENGDDDKTVNNIPVSLPQNSDSETEDEELSRNDSSVVPVKTTWKHIVVPRPDGSRNDILL
ncbi:hypothetical protein TNIN_312121 [Trichonephila inaurata madagascariensis]|uniref:Uncharacterized protein n=1 Tax=Trichonephila inaurata madagascariensis TaxID=2747483 RepID=A0A8X6KBI4_9ARAC|nr:hypothetical protein TNIN_312121 [Trichonephila inaurata madagascariensis]